MKKDLSIRQKEILKHLMDGLTDKEIAEKEFIELSTVKTHIYRIFRFYGVNSRIKLIVKLYKEREVNNAMVRQISAKD